MSKRHPRTISASELGNYIYCSRAGWLEKVQGEVGDATLKAKRVTAGNRGHEQHGRTVQTYQHEGVWLRYLLLAAAALLTAWILITLI